MKTKLAAVSYSLFAIFCTVSSAHAANLLLDPSFENNVAPFFINTALSDFPTYQGQWWAEAATVVPTTGSITPPDGSYMLRITGNAPYDQAGQLTDVSSYAALINSGNATINLSALFNVPDGVSGAHAAVEISYFTSANYYAPNGSSIIGSLTLDNNYTTWETASVSGIVTVGTTWVLSQVVYTDSTLAGGPGYVYQTSLTIVPEPGMSTVLGLGACALLVRRRRVQARP